MGQRAPCVEGVVAAEGAVGRKSRRGNGLLTLT